MIDSLQVRNVLDVGCPQCHAGRGEPCHTPTRRTRSPHTRRERVHDLAAHHQPVQWRDGWPVAVLVSLSGVHDREGHRTLRILCPICWRHHYHGWDAFEDTDWTHRVAHCGPTSADLPGSYLIPPTADLLRTTR